MNQEVVEMSRKFNSDQRLVCDEVTASVDSGSGRVLFSWRYRRDWKNLLSRVRRDRKIATVMGSSGIAATLLKGSKTVQSAFKLTLNFNSSETPVWNISKQSNIAQLLRGSVDYVGLMHRQGIEALEASLQDNKSLMAGVTISLAGNFRQTLPVVPGRTCADEVKTYLMSSSL